MALPRWLVSLFVDPAFDEQMRAHDEARDLRRLQRFRLRGGLQTRDPVRARGRRLARDTVLALMASGLAALIIKRKGRSRQ